MKRTMTRLLLTALLMAVFSLYSTAQNLTFKVYKRNADTDYFGKVLIPQGGKYKMKRTPKAGATVELFYGHIDTNKNRIYMMKMMVIEDCYFIDATSCTHAFVVRSNTPDDVVLEPATAEDDALVVSSDGLWFDLALSRQNKLRFNSEVIANNILQTNATYKAKNIYVMANPALRGLAFAWLDQFGTSRNLPANSLYVLGKKTTTSAPELEIVWPEGEEVGTITAVQSVKNSEITNDAVYSLQGLRVTNMQKGHIYIRNGRKFVAQ